MTANIVQNVVPRQSLLQAFSPYQGSAGEWQTRLLPARRLGTKTFHSSRARAQRGSINHATVTLTVSLVGLICISLLGFFYLQQVLHTASTGSSVQSLEVKLDDLGERQRQLELEGAQLRSIKNVEDRVQQLNMVTTGRVAYLHTPETRVSLAAPQ